MRAWLPFTVGVLFLGGTAVPAGAAVAAVDYVALGDSYAAGTGSSASGDSCGRRSTGYPALWAASHAVTSYQNLACARDRTSDVLSEQISALGAGSDLVTLTVGGNDIGFIDTIVTCVLWSDDSCLGAIADGNEILENDLPGRLDTVNAAIRAAAPDAEVVVVGYPWLFEPGTCPGGLSLVKRQALNDTADRLDDLIAARAQAAGFTFADVRTAFEGHRVCSGTPWLNRVDLLALTATYHPNDTGYEQGYLATLNKLTD
ncbi:lipase 1 [Actinoplanes lobatus]|uniref:Lipase 1 n=1 Tax=Actinoplanes lobatus TaxID=113568 RepID=A0A7W7HNX8_9ACTN|nr:SGNH/GDSL hydrolase family protein [Actinoplanes lobatus]MBB4754016.1 lysophospholipase L1-like esterase [Actinoplanes lobatus]GGN76457.1 lipase 1 [Actinoplanes lobatus]GIE40927.1 lipase 1 [Actinoplanes lobatus]